MLAASGELVASVAIEARRTGFVSRERDAAEALVFRKYRREYIVIAPVSVRREVMMLFFGCLAGHLIHSSYKMPDFSDIKIRRNICQADVIEPDVERCKSRKTTP